MAIGDYDGPALIGMSGRAADPHTSAFEKAKDALRVAPQLTATDLQFCIAFSIDPFSYLAAKELEGDAIAAERERRVASEQFHEREQRQREAWGQGVIRAEQERLRGYEA